MCLVFPAEKAYLAGNRIAGFDLTRRLRQIQPDAHGPALQVGAGVYEPAVAALGWIAQALRLDGAAFRRAAQYGFGQNRAVKPTV